MVQKERVQAELSSLTKKIHGELPAVFSAVTADSRRVVEGALFVAVDGVRADGRDHLAEARQAGAAAVAMKWSDRSEPWPGGVAGWEVTDTRRAAALLMRLEAGKPDEKLDLFGVTGTNGKTTTAFLLSQLLNECGIPCGLLSTIENRTGKRRETASCTTPDAAALAASFSEMVKNGMRTAALELSSHSLDQGRAYGLKFRAAIFTNLTGDHLDYHKTMENYFQAKKRFFTELLAPGGAAVINVDDPWGARLAKELAGKAELLTFGSADSALWRITKLTCGPDHSAFTLENRETGENNAFTLPLIGEHNVRNAAGVLLALTTYGIPAETLAGLLRKEFQIPGRLERIVTSRGVVCYVDYAHTDDALTNVLSILRRITPPGQRLYALFGAGGDRDRSKRPRMGKAAAALADRILLTSDNPRTEDPLAILGEIRAGIPAGFPCEVEPDRERAIVSCLRAARPGDVVLIAGKGHEDYQEIRGVRRHFSDREIAGKQ